MHLPLINLHLLLNLRLVILINQVLQLHLFHHIHHIHHIHQVHTHLALKTFMFVVIREKMEHMLNLIIEVALEDKQVIL